MKNYNRSLRFNFKLSKFWDDFISSDKNAKPIESPSNRQGTRLIFPNARR